MNTLINTALFVFIVGATAWVGPALDEATEAKRTAERQIAEQQRIERRERAAREICGENASFRFDDATLTCFTKRGRKTRQVQM